jgi:hypothetical protein
MVLSRIYARIPSAPGQCEACLRAKIERYPKNGEAPQLRGGANGIGLDIDLAGPLDASVDGHRYLFVGVERSSGIVFAALIGSKAEAMRVVKEALTKLERQLGDRVRVIRSYSGTEFATERRSSGTALPEFSTTPRRLDTRLSSTELPRGWYAHLRRSPHLS